jgi:hypothetical protein
MKKVILVGFVLILAGCATQKEWTPSVTNPDAMLKTNLDQCEDVAYTAAGQAMSNIQYNLSEYNDRQMLINCSSANGCPNMPLQHSWDSGAAYGKDSPTGYRGLGSRQAYTAAYKECLTQRGYKLAVK